MAISNTAGAHGRRYVVLPGAGRQPGIYPSWPAAEAQILGYSNGKAIKFAALDLALAYWAENAPGMEPEVFAPGVPVEVESPVKAEAAVTSEAGGTLVYVGRDGLQLSRTIEGGIAERVLRFMRHGQPLA